MSHRLFIFTGKGGVGKTTLAMAFTKYLKSKNVKVLYNSFYQIPPIKKLEVNQLPYLDISVEGSAQKYIGKKLNSETIAQWIMKTHFFKSLFQMIPGFGHMLLLGNIINELENDPELVVVLDSPASGHALTMFESSDNFKKIFKTGLIVKDIDRMKFFLENSENVKTHIIALPNELAWQEALELKSEIDPIYKNTEIIINNSFKKYFSLNKIDELTLPDFLKKKCELEEQLASDKKSIPHINEVDLQGIINDLQPFMESLS